MKTILVPVDFSRNSENAMNYAVELAKKEKAKLILLHAVHVNYAPPELIDKEEHVIREILKKKAEVKLQNTCSKILKSKKIRCEYKIGEGYAMDVILKTAGKLGVNLIIMGAKGAGKIERLVFGSNTARVIATAKVPVIAVPGKAKFKDLKKITYATDYHASDIPAIKKLAELAKPFKAEINVMHAGDKELTPESENEFLERFKRKAGKSTSYKHIHYTIEYGSELEKVLQNHIKKTHPDLFAMSTKRRNLMEKLFGSSATKNMVYHTDIPLLAFHHKQNSVIFI